MDRVLFFVILLDLLINLEVYKFSISYFLNTNIPLGMSDIRLHACPIDPMGETQSSYHQLFPPRDVFHKNGDMEHAMSLKRAFVSHNGVILGRGLHRIPFCVRASIQSHTFAPKRTTFSNIYVLDCTTIATNEPFSLTYNPDAGEYFHQDVLNVAKPAGPVQDMNMRRLKVMFYGALPISVVDLICHIGEFLYDSRRIPQEHTWKRTRSIFYKHRNEKK